MNIWLGQQLPTPLPPSAVTIGNFDGVHTGHRHILQRLASEAQAHQLHSVAIIFEPQPNEFFSRQANREQPQRITPLRDKIQLLQQTGSVDSVWVQRFNQHFANQTAEQFIQTILREQLNTRYLLIGDDFRFGKGRGGDFALLAAQGAHRVSLLWASTGVKNPDYPATLYVDALIGEHTINTVPDATLKAFIATGTAARTLPENIPAALAQLAEAEKLGIDLETLATRLQNDGLKQFEEAFEKLLAPLAA